MDVEVERTVEVAGVVVVIVNDKISVTVGANTVLGTVVVVAVSVVVVVTTELCIHLEDTLSIR